MINDQKARAQHELDVVVTTRARSGATRVAAIGEAKHTTRARTVADLERLERIRTLLADRGDATPSTRLLLFSASGFDRNLTAVADARDVAPLTDASLLRQLASSR